MIQEDKQLLLKDLCARLPYGVIVKEQCGDYIHVNIYNAHLEHLIDRISLGLDKLALRPMSSMTEEEKKEFYYVDGVLSIDFEFEEYKMVHLLKSHNYVVCEFR